MSQTKKIEVMVLGSFHFMEADELDYTSINIQRQLQQLTKKLARFNPDKIIVEAPFESQACLTDSYHSLPAHYFSDTNVMKKTDLGLMEIAGERYPITYVNEAVQIGYRLAQQLKKETLYAIDSFTWSDESEVYELAEKEIVGWGEVCTQFTKHRDEEEQRLKKSDDLIELYRFVNGRWSARQHSLFYLALNQLGAGKDYKGAKFLSRWYERNLKIFANLQIVTQDCDRVLVIYGAGHKAILENLINDYEEMKLVNVLDYL